MATGDVGDMAARIGALLPGGWFAPLAEAPILNGLLSGIGAGWSFCYGLLAVARAQARLSTASGSFLDMIAADFFGAGLPRRTVESDDDYRARIGVRFLAERATRPAVIAAVAALDGAVATVFEPMRPADTGGYGAASAPTMGGGAGYGTAGGGYGSLSMPFAFFVDVQRPEQTAALAAVAPYGAGGAVPAAIGTGGGYGGGALEYLDLRSFRTAVSDADVQTAIVASLPVGVVAWIRLR